MEIVRLMAAVILLAGNVFIFVMLYKIYKLLKKQGRI
jgi:hypothetical protein